jgi:hypothetical protein
MHAAQEAAFDLIAAIKQGLESNPTTAPLGEALLWGRVVDEDSGPPDGS